MQYKSADWRDNQQIGAPAFRSQLALNAWEKVRAQSATSELPQNDERTRDLR